MTYHSDLQITLATEPMVRAIAKLAQPHVFVHTYKYRLAVRNNNILVATINDRVLGFVWCDFNDHKPWLLKQLTAVNKPVTLLLLNTLCDEADSVNQTITTTTVNETLKLFGFTIETQHFMVRKPTWQLRAENQHP